MSSFDSAIHYGPNDAGISAFSILMVSLGLLIVSWFFGAAYGFLSGLIAKSRQSSSLDQDNENISWG